MSDWDKRWTETNVGLVQTSYWYKRRTSTNVGRVHLKGKNVGLWFSLKKKTIAIALTYCDENQRQLNKVSFFEGSTV